MKYNNIVKMKGIYLSKFTLQYIEILFIIFRNLIFIINVDDNN